MNKQGAKLLTFPREISCAAMPRLWIRTVAGRGTGFGHLRRTCVLARILDNCCVPLFLLDSADVGGRDVIRGENFAWYDQGLETCWNDLQSPAAIVIDTRVTAGLDQFIARAKRQGIPVISIHDLGLEMLPSDVVIDGSIAPLPAESVSPAARYCTGPEYMVLDPDFGRLHTQRKEISGRIKSVFINLGGGDSSRIFQRVLEGLKMWGREVDVIGVPGFLPWGQEHLRSLDWGPVNFRWEAGNLTRHLFEADLAITAGGLAAYESLCAGTPLICVAHDRLQQITITRLAEAQSCINIGLGDELSPATLGRVLSDLEGNVVRRKKLSEQGRLIVDGRGAERVAGLIREKLDASTSGIPEISR